MTTQPNRQEIKSGIIYLIIQQFILPWVLLQVNSLLPKPMDAVQLNFTYYFFNFTVILLLFRKFLLQSLLDALKQPIGTIWYVILGYMGSQFLGTMVYALIVRIYPDYANVNDAVIAQLAESGFALMAIGTIVLVPVVEETLFRGVIFRGLYDRSPALAYLISICGFSAMHLLGYLGELSPMMLGLSFLQYLPMGYCLAFSYRHSGNILAPILLHMANNAIALYAMR